MEISSLINLLPKAEVHTHLEVSLPISRVYEIAKRNDVTLPLSYEDCIYKSTHYEGLCDFLSILRVACSALKFEQDFYELALSYFKISYENNIVYTEPQYQSCNFTKYGVSEETILNGLWRAIQEAETNYGMQINLLYGIGRGASVESSINSLYFAKQHSEKFKGIAFAGNEFLHPAKYYKEIFDLSSNLGLAGPNDEFLAVHTGEEAPPEIMIETLHNFKIGRIDHGIRALEDPFLVKMLSTHQIPMGMCPISNKALKALDQFPERNYIYNDFLDHGCLISINTDGPAWCGGELSDNYLDFANHNMHLNAAELSQKVVKISENSFKCSFLSESDKTRYINSVRRIADNLTTLD
ncbi:unnamed protein product [Blepharisma stoltei]|uniref:Adenosine deaminase domain-containing protein n=1 Tax=Blepharisma stoltei TaxID=1481888 RepID=A0AAU9KEY5_9CILI|nr:unnamed protein product [Blepharisma stoltei]